MNRFQILIFLAYVLIQGVEYWLTFLNMRHMKKYGMDVPSGFERFIDKEVLGRTLAYAAERNRLGLIESLFGAVVTIVFIFGGLLDAYNSWIASLNLSFVLKGVVFFLLLAGASSLLSAPLGLYGTFRIENRYGFNAMTLRLWLADFLKSALLSAVLGGAVLAVSFWLMAEFPLNWWLLIWGFFFVFSMFLMYISPYVIEPLFNKFTPLEADELKEEIRAVMARAGISVGRVFTMDASKRSRHTNAYFTGLGRVKRIVLFDTLLQMMDKGEVVSVLAHEAGHWKKKHVLKGLALFQLISLVAAFTAHRMLQSDVLTGIFGIGQATVFAKVVILGFLFGLVSFPFTAAFNALSRRHEKEADDFAVRLTAAPEDLATSLIKLSKDNLSNFHPHPLYAWFYYSHPPVVGRVRRILGA